MALFKKRPKPVQLGHLGELEPMLESGKPVLLDFFQFGCAPCKVMDGIVNELAEEYAGSAHVVKVNVQRVPGAAETFKIRSTPTFILIGGTSRKQSKKARQKEAPAPVPGRMNPRWRASGLVKKDFLVRQLEGSGAVAAGRPA